MANLELCEPTVVLSLRKLTADFPNRLVVKANPTPWTVQPLPRRGPSNPGGCAPRAATPLAQPGASYVSQSSPFITQQLGFLFGKGEVATSASPAKLTLLNVQGASRGPQQHICYTNLIPVPSFLFATLSYQL